MVLRRLLIGNLPHFFVEFVDESYVVIDLVDWMRDHSLYRRIFRILIIGWSLSLHFGIGRMLLSSVFIET